MKRILILPSITSDNEFTKAVLIPDGMSENKAITQVKAAMQALDEDSDDDWDNMATELKSRGLEPCDATVGPCWDDLWG